MPLNLRAQNNVRQFNAGVSYRAGDNGGKLLDARNVNSVQNRLDTRFGTSRYNSTTLGGKIQSLSSFIKTDGTAYVLAKIGTELYSVSVSGAHTLLKTGLSATEIHRGITVNDRHIIAIGTDATGGMYSFNGTVFTTLGLTPPAAPVLALNASGSLANTTIYKVAISFYASTLGLESNYSESNEITTTTSDGLDVSGLPVSSTNPLVDKVYIYLKNVTTNGQYIFVNEVALGVGTFPITQLPLSSEVATISNGVPISGGGRFLVQFGNQTVYSGNDTYKNDVFFSEPNLPDAYDDTGDGLVLKAPGNGAVTGLATGFFSDAHLSPYLVIFKRKSIHIYSNLDGGDLGNFACINDKIGCVSHDTIILKNGTIFFLSEEGWRGIYNGQLLSNKSNEVITLGEGDIDDIFRSPGYVYEVNKGNIHQAFSVYYPALDQYMTFLCEGANYAFTKAYVYEFDTAGFKPWEFATPGTCVCLSKNTDGNDIVLIGTANGYILKHSIYESRKDVDSAGSDKAINAFAILPWTPDDPDFDATYNYRELIAKSVAAGEVTVKTFLNYGSEVSLNETMEFDSAVDGIIFDESLFADEDSEFEGEATFGGDREILTSRLDLNQVGESIAFGFYQNTLNGNIGLISLQLDLSKNGNRNIAGEDEDDEVYGSEEDLLQFVLTPSQVQTALSALSTRISNLEAMIDLGPANTDSSWRFRVVAGQFLTQVRLAGNWVTRKVTDENQG